MIKKVIEKSVRNFKFQVFKFKGEWDRREGRGLSTGFNVQVVLLCVIVVAWCVFVECLFCLRVSFVFFFLCSCFFVSFFVVFC